MQHPFRAIIGITGKEWEEGSHMLDKIDLKTKISKERYTERMGEERAVWAFSSVPSGMPRSQ